MAKFSWLGDGRPARLLCGILVVLANPAAAIDLVVRDVRTGVGLDASLLMAPALGPSTTRRALAAALEHAGPRAQ